MNDRGFRADRHPSETYEDILERDTRPIPHHLRQGATPDLGDSAIPVTVYFDPDIFAKEVRHVWLKVWQWACREEQIPNPGDVHIYENVGKSVIIVRQDDGSIKAFYNVCLHRGRKIVDSNGPRVDLRCKYHGMAWHCSGGFKYNPIEWDFPQWKDADMSLPELRVDCWGGFVFVNFDKDARPLSELIKPMADEMDRYDFEERYLAAHISKIMPCNWKVAAEAFMESHHSLTTHPQLTPYIADVNSQYDALSEHVTRHFTATGVPSPLVADRNIDDLAILKAMEATGGSPAAEDAAEVADAAVTNGPVNQARGTLDAPRALEEGVTARMFAAEATRKSLEAEDGWDYSDVSDAEMLDALLYNLFPNMSFWGGFAPNLIYRWRPNGLDPETAIMDVLILKRVPKGAARASPAKEVRLGIHDSWSSTSMTGALGPILDQDIGNIVHVQAGLRSSGNGVVHFGLYSEMRLRLLHQLIARMIAEGEACGDE